MNPNTLTALLVEFYTHLTRDSIYTCSMSMRTGGKEIVASDGKILPCALNQGKDLRVIVSAWATESGLLLGRRHRHRRRAALSKNPRQEKQG